MTKINLVNILPKLLFTAQIICDT